MFYLFICIPLSPLSHRRRPFNNHPGELTAARAAAGAACGEGNVGKGVGGAWLGGQVIQQSAG